MPYHFTQFFSLDSPKAIKARAFVRRVSRALPWRTLRSSVNA
jgi:hypothetical protein